MRKKLKRFLKRIKRDKRIFNFLLSKFSKKSKIVHLYAFTVTNKELVKIKFLKFFKTRFRDVRFIFTRYKFTQNISFKRGEGKIVVVDSNKAHYLYLSNWVYKVAKNNYLSNKDLIPYEITKIHSFNDEELSAVAEKVEINPINEIFSLNYFFENISKTKIINKYGVDRLCSVQHGDAKPGNITSINNKIIFFDLDFIAYLPLMTDFIHYVSNTTRDKEIVKQYISANFVMLAKLYEGFRDFDNADDLYNEIINGYIDQYRNKPKTFLPLYDFLL